MAWSLTTDCVTARICFGVELETNRVHALVSSRSTASRLWPTDQIQAVQNAGGDAVELHTGRYAAQSIKYPGHLSSGKETNPPDHELLKLRAAAKEAHQRKLIVNAGHGLDYANVRPIAAIPEINELNIGFSIIARAVFVGIELAVREMKILVTRPVRELA